MDYIVCENENCKEIISESGGYSVRLETHQGEEKYMYVCSDCYSHITKKYLVDDHFHLLVKIEYKLCNLDEYLPCSFPTVINDLISEYIRFDFLYFPKIKLQDYKRLQDVIQQSVRCAAIEVNGYLNKQLGMSQQEIMIVTLGDGNDDYNALELAWNTFVPYFEKLRKLTTMHEMSPSKEFEDKLLKYLTDNTYYASKYFEPPPLAINQVLSDEQEVIKLKEKIKQLELKIIENRATEQYLFSKWTENNDYNQFKALRDANKHNLNKRRQYQIQSSTQKRIKFD